ncbi:MerR family transcriptional regulator [Actinomycetes bacterium NPDC127524]
MNTVAAAELLGVSPRTIQRWVKQFNLKMEKNELGHYSFTEENINQLREIHAQSANPVSPADHKDNEKPRRKGKIEASEESRIAENLMARFNEMESRLESKADSVVTYQILQHRREIEDLQSQIKALTKRLEKAENAAKGTSASSAGDMAIFDSGSPQKKQKKKKLLSALFSF